MSQPPMSDPVQREPVGPLTIGIDIGGTKVAGGLVDVTGTVVRRTRRTTPSTDPHAVRRTIAEVVGELRDGVQVVGVGIGAAGFVDADRTLRRGRRNARSAGCWTLYDEEAAAAVHRRAGR